MADRLRPILALLVLWACAGRARAEIELSLPTGGVYQPGRYLPVVVRLTASAATAAAVPADVTLRAPGAVPTVVPAGALAGGRAVLVPWLPVSGEPRTLEASARGQPTRSMKLSPLADDERLVATTGGAEADVTLARGLFPGRRASAVVAPRAGEGSPAAAWEAFDAIVFDHMPGPTQVDALFAAGVTIAVRGTEPPPAASRWPWALREGYWILPRDPAGPRGVVVPGAYDPPQMWDAGRPAAMRRSAVLGLVMTSLVLIGLSLLRPRRAVVAVSLAGLVAAGAAVAWRRGLSPAVEATGAVIVTSDALTQRDDWIYRRHFEPADGAIAPPAADVLLKPVFASARQIDRTGIVLRAAGDGPTAFTYRLRPGETIAFLATRLAPGRWPGAVAAGPVATPARELVPAYASPGLDVLGEAGEPVRRVEGITRWPALVLERR